MPKRADQWRPGEALFVTYAEMSTTEDSYEQGEIGRDMIVWQGGISGPYRNFGEIVEHFIDEPGAPKSKDAWAVYEDEGGRIEAQWLVNVDNYAADNKEIEAWKRGKTQLWSARLAVWIIAARIHGPPKSEDIADATGFVLV